MKILEELKENRKPKTQEEEEIEKTLLKEIYNIKSLSEWLKSEIKGGKQNDCIKKKHTRSN